MVFALGFLIAGLAALAFAPAFWARAMRLSRRRIEMQMPQSMQEILAERDQLRAEHALEHRRLEQKAESLNLRHAADMGELGRHVTDIVRLENNVVSLSAANSELTGALAATERELAEATAGFFALSKALHDATGLHERKSEELAELVRAHDDLNMHAQEQHAGLIALETRAYGLQMRLEDLGRELVAADTKLHEKSRETLLMSDDLALARSEIVSLAARSESLQRKLDAETQRSAAQALALNAAQEEASQRTAELRALAGKLDLTSKNLEEAERRHEEVAQQRAQDLVASRNAERSFGEKLDALRSENAGLQGALEAARRECERLQQDLAAYTHGGANGAALEGDALLRQTIHEIGAAIIKLAKGEAAAPAPKLESRSAEPASEDLRLM